MISRNSAMQRTKASHRVNVKACCFLANKRTEGTSCMRQAVNAIRQHQRTCDVSAFHKADECKACNGPQGCNHPHDPREAEKHVVCVHNCGVDQAERNLCTQENTQAYK